MWLAVLAGGPGADLTPVGGAGTDITTYILGYGPLGVAAVLLAIAMVRGTFTRSSEAERRLAEQQARSDQLAGQIRADWAAERDRLTQRAEKAERLHEDALRAMTDQFIPLMTGFEAATRALIPILQGQVREQQIRDQIAREAYERGQHP